MNVCGTIAVSTLPGTTELGGGADGKWWYDQARLLFQSVGPGVLVLDFADVRLATVSWLREGAIALIREVGLSKPAVIPVAVNLQSLVREELEIALDATNTVLITAVVTPSGKLTQPELIGHLDLALRETLDVVGDSAAFDASLVSKALPHVSLSAANNRLAALKSKGVLKSARRGRGTTYSPVLEGLNYGR